MAALAGGDFEPWRYADPACTALREALALRLGVDAGVTTVWIIRQEAEGKYAQGYSSRSQALHQEASEAQKSISWLHGLW